MNVGFISILDMGFLIYHGLTFIHILRQDCGRSKLMDLSNQHYLELSAMSIPFLI